MGKGDVIGDVWREEVRGCGLGCKMRRSKIYVVGLCLCFIWFDICIYWYLGWGFDEILLIIYIFGFVCNELGICRCFMLISILSFEGGRVRFFMWSFVFWDLIF